MGKWNYWHCSLSQKRSFCSDNEDSPILLIRGTHIIDVGEHPGLNTQLSSSSDDSCNDLSFCCKHPDNGNVKRIYLAHEHLTWGNFHIVPKLEIRHVLQRLSHGNVTPGLKHHHCWRKRGSTCCNTKTRRNRHTNWTSWKSISNDEFRNDTIKADKRVAVEN